MNGDEGRTLCKEHPNFVWILQHNSRESDDDIVQKAEYQDSKSTKYLYWFISMQASESAPLCFIQKINQYSNPS